MDKAKKILLEETYKSFINVFVTSGDPAILSKLVAKSIMGFGTTTDEKIFNLEELQELVQRQQQQSEGIPMKWNVTSLHRHISEEENTAIFVDEIDFQFDIDGHNFNMNVRLSAVVEYEKEKWLVVHFHGSKPEEVESDKDTYGIHTWKEKAEALEKTVAERTSELLIKNRELEIEAALDRVRGRSMAMRTSEELKEVIQVVYDQFITLNIKVDHTGFIIDYNNREDMHIWLADRHEVPNELCIPYFDSPHWNSFNAAKEKGSHFFTNQLTHQEKNKFYTELFTLIEAPEEIKEFYLTCPALAISTALVTDVGLYIENFQGVPYSDEENETLMRFAKVFQQTYTRFLDLQKAEAQAREAKIETALEKVRSRTMAMQKSEELRETSMLLFQQVEELGIKSFACGFNIWDEDKRAATAWMATADRLQPPFKTNSSEDVYLLFYEAEKRGEALFVLEQEGKELEAHYKYLVSIPEVKQLAKAGLSFPKFQIIHCAYFSKGYLMFITYEPVPQAHDIFIRFANVFEQTYTRFLDLQKAEAQTQEAKVEAALEKVRTVALTLKKSDDMLEIAQVLYEQLLALGFTYMRNAIIDIHNDDNETFLDYDYSHDMSSAVTEFSFYGDPVIEQQIKQTQSSNDAFFEIELKGEELKELIKMRIKNGEKDDPRLHKIDHLTYNLYSFGNGAIGISNFGILSDEQKKTLKRFRNVFTFAYKRYTDLATAEAQALESKIEAALERVRSAALGLNKSEDMLEVAQALYEQLITLGFSNIRNSIIDVDNEDGETFLDYDYSHEMGGTVTPMSYKDDPTLKEQLEDIIATTDGYSEMTLEGKQFLDLIEMRRKNGEAEDPRLLNTDSISYILYAFGKGAIGISNFGVLTENQKTILSRFRNVFSFAYKRYADLAQSEVQAAALLAEKQRLEVTLADLQATQKQLIQSEKMASLGELTAGIAHEIQNPLNFVNNFSEVNRELSEEITEEAEKGNVEEIKLLAKDIRENSEKINHHGRRADAIVKGMLLHSRSNTGEKAPTRINALADEFLKLAYHGLRAKDKSFNAKLVTDYDDSIGKINVVQQDMGRVILNLITNAFYACTERSRSAVGQPELPEKSGHVYEDGLIYEPTVSISTKKIGGKVEIKVTDNGNGIPKKVLEKIFQPFFTTKPTGQGTGLGLSLAYDIVQAHGGELIVETKEGEGTEFIIQLPL